MTLELLKLPGEADGQRMVNRYTNNRGCREGKKGEGKKPNLIYPGKYSGMPVLPLKAAGAADPLHK